MGQKRDKKNKSAQPQHNQRPQGHNQYGQGNNRGPPPRQAIQNVDGKGLGRLEGRLGSIVGILQWWVIGCLEGEHMDYYKGTCLKLRCHLL